MRKILTSAMLIGMIGSANLAFAQYPVIPESMEKKADSLLKEIERLSELQFLKVKPIVDAEAKLGKPYIPWAAKPSDLPQSKLLAFPGAEGGGAYTFGGRGGKVYVVNTLADAGPGSLREACEQGGARIVVFNVSGIIKLKTPLIIRAPYITIAGQSAPGDGICVAGESVWLNTHDVIIRFMRFRRGATDVTRRDDAIGGNPVGNIIIDHVSASWGLDENMSIYRHVYDPKDGSKPVKLPTVNVTIQNSIFSEALDTYNHAFGSTIGGLNSTFMRNLWASNISRNPSVGMYGDFGFVNNVVFNWWNRSADGGDNASFYSFINNYYKPGPITPAGEPIAYRILKPESGRDKKFTNEFGRAYVTGNIVEGNERVTKNNWDGGVQPESRRDKQKLLDSIRTNTPLPMAKVSLIDAKQAYTYVLANAGASLPKRDAVDLRIVEQVRTGKIQHVEDEKLPAKQNYVKRRLANDSYKKGIISDIAQVGGYPAYKGTPHVDSDKDGIPDAWESKNGLNPKNAADAVKISKNGYANIEVYLNSLVEIGKVKP
ncbi:polysaccharide lyase [Pedobacter frigiditerrae]|uniref:Polysaccharide lyase n=1 Tax=Pedobacter frigiditerrae TaxID=2530452 RepID=A0A4V2MIE1_9SPHI|nr:polysaccharide lyase [Pedobacter frigiditerrae]TCC90016.1 polysaccharide lyase [Pedobacter frigiditerrae]